MCGQNQSQDPNTWWDNSVTWENSHFQLGMPAGTSQDAHRQSPPAMIGWAGGLLPTPSLQLLQYESTTPSALHHPFPAGFPLHTVGRGCQAPHRLPRNSLCRKSDAGDFSIIFCQPGRVWFIKMHFPFHMYFVLKQTNAGRCHSSCSCTLDTSQLKYLLTLSLTSQNQA